MVVGKAEAVLLRGLALNILEIAQVCRNSNAVRYSHWRLWLHRRSAVSSTYRICHHCIPCRRYSPCNCASSCLPAFLQEYKAVPECRGRQRKAFPTDYLLPRCIRKYHTPIPASAFWPFCCLNILETVVIISINPLFPKPGILLKISGHFRPPPDPRPRIQAEASANILTWEYLFFSNLILMESRINIL